MGRAFLLKELEKLMKGGLTREQALNEIFRRIYSSFKDVKSGYQMIYLRGDSKISKIIDYLIKSDKIYKEGRVSLKNYIKIKMEYIGELKN